MQVWKILFLEVRIVNVMLKGLTAFTYNKHKRGLNCSLFPHAPNLISELNVKSPLAGTTSFVCCDQQSKGHRVEPNRSHRSHFSGLLHQGLWTPVATAKWKFKVAKLFSLLWNLQVANYIFLKFIFIYLLFLAVLGLRCCAQAFSSYGEQGLLFVAVRGLLIAEHGL